MYAYHNSNWSSRKAVLQNRLATITYTFTTCFHKQAWPKRIVPANAVVRALTSLLLCIVTGQNEFFQTAKLSATRARWADHFFIQSTMNERWIADISTGRSVLKLKLSVSNRQTLVASETGPTKLQWGHCPKWIISWHNWPYVFSFFQLQIDAWNVKLATQLFCKRLCSWLFIILQYCICKLNY